MGGLRTLFEASKVFLEWFLVVSAQYRLKKVEKVEISGFFNDSSLFTRFHQESVIFNEKHRYAPFDIGSSCSIDLGMCERRPGARLVLSTTWKFIFHSY